MEFTNNNLPQPSENPTISPGGISPTPYPAPAPVDPTLAPLPQAIDSNPPPTPNVQPSPVPPPPPAPLNFPPQTTVVPVPPPLPPVSGPSPIPPAVPSSIQVPPVPPVPPVPDFNPSPSSVGGLLSKAALVLSFLVLGFGTFSAVTAEPVASLPGEEVNSCTAERIGHRYPLAGNFESLFLHADSDYPSYEGIIVRQKAEDGIGMSYVLTTNFLPEEEGSYYLWVADRWFPDPNSDNVLPCNVVLVGELEKISASGPWVISFSDQQYPDDFAVFAVTNRGYGSLPSYHQSQFSFGLDEIVLFGSYVDNWEE
ncbi:MAG: hypothetical protein UY40_C0001G0032 [candidate division CPR1 bacterium GW2011_GWC1_49_13]|uniref:Uncharacterized protein n=1 Tax=candidate division CPR1 bacterium GW2011_GWC1_49_13 TaxID=1618342 RepID=A0A0G1YIN3_9BACT|nr:MAG: hypothetical protein UY40_C0001G0032 [candidate division CPR1 bacterium GW2011_GWC1_49_13]